MDRIQAMRIFVKIVEQGSFQRAATLLHHSTAVISRHIADLEHQLGVRLLNRTTRKLSLTEAGQIYYVRVQRILSDIEDAESLTSSSAKEPDGKFRLYSQLGFGQFCLPEILSGYAHLHPKTTLEVTVSDRNINLIEEGYDVGIYSGIQKINGSMIGRQLAITEIVFCASPIYLETHGIPEQPSDLGLHDCLCFSFENLDKKWPVLGYQEEHLVPIQSKFVSNNLELLRHYARKGMGIILSPSYSLEEDLRNGSLVRVLPKYHARKIPLILAYPNRKLLSTTVRNFVDFMARTFPFPETDPWIDLASLKAS